MKISKKTMLFFVLVIVLAVFSGCQPKNKEIFQEAGKTTPVVQKDALATPEPVPEETVVPEDYYITDESLDAVDLPYNPLDEEETDAYNAQGVYNEFGQSVYAGTTPIPIDPVDMPTPTPRPDLVFNYTAAMSSKLGLQFEMPNDWVVITDSDTTFAIQDPTERDNKRATLTITVAPVASNYSMSAVKEDLGNTLKNLQKSYVEWQNMISDKRTLMEAEGYYNTYRGVMYDGTIVRGLVHIVAENGKEYTVHLEAPGWFNSSYLKVYTKLRNTLKAI